MAHLSSSSLWAEIKAQAPKAYRAGIHFFVVIEGHAGDWFALHADDQGHAARLAQVSRRNAAATDSSSDRLVRPAQ